MYIKYFPKRSVKNEYYCNVGIQVALTDGWIGRKAGQRSNTNFRTQYHIDSLSWLSSLFWALVTLLDSSDFAIVIWKFQVYYVFFGVPGQAQSRLLYKVAKWLPTLNSTSHSQISVANSKSLGRLHMFVDLFSNW